MDTNQLTRIATESYDKQAQNNQLTAHLVQQQHEMLEELKKQTAARATRRELAETGTQVGTAQIIERVSRGTQSELTGGRQLPPPGRGRTSRSPHRVQDQPEQEPGRKPTRAEATRPAHTIGTGRAARGSGSASSSAVPKAKAQPKAKAAAVRVASFSSDPDL